MVGGPPRHRGGIRDGDELLDPCDSRGEDSSGAIPGGGVDSAAVQGVEASGAGCVGLCC